MGATLVVLILVGVGQHADGAARSVEAALEQAARRPVTATVREVTFLFDENSVARVATESKSDVVVEVGWRDRLHEHAIVHLHGRDGRMLRASDLTASCASAGCHVKGAGTNVKNLDLSVGSAYANLVNKAAVECADGRLLVKPTDPAASYLMQKLTNVNLCGTGTQMPKKGSSLPAADIITISNWMCEGAPSN